MMLINLKIVIDGRLTREVEFKGGLNLVTNRKDAGRSGNSVGKSTLSRVVDYIFLASIDPIYIDDEFKKPNEKIEALFNNSRVEARLAFVGVDKKLHELTRNLHIKTNKQEFFVDGRLVAAADYEETVQALCFNVSTKRPSVRAIVPKFIRNDSHRMLNTTKFLDARVAAKDYSELFLYLFGFENTALLTEKRDLTNVASRRKRNSTVLNALVKEQKPLAEASKYRNEIQALERDFLKFEYSSEYEDPIGRLSELQDDENVAVEGTLALERKISNIYRTLDILGSMGGNYLINEVRAIYEFAGVVVDLAIKKYEDVLSFHDHLVSKKKQFLVVELPELNERLAATVKQLEDIRSLKMAVFADMRSEDSVIKITENLRVLGDLKLNLGKAEGLISQQQVAANELRAAEDRLRVVLAEISKGLGFVQDFEKKFNENFKEITRETHAEPYFFSLAFDEESGACNVDVKNTVSNPEGGKKKAEVIAFDFAYIFAVAQTKLHRPLFVFHDSIEDIDQKQIEIIFSISRTLPGQQILSMLSDKLSEKMYEEYSPDIILLLSEDDMFFGV